MVVLRPKRTIVSSIPVVPNCRKTCLHDNERLKINDMKNLRFKKSRLISNLSVKENKKIFRVMNVALIIGGLSLVLTFLFLIANLNKADEIVIYCLPGFVFGLVLMILYAIGHQRLTKILKQPRIVKSLSFRR
jgi:hypothetical protein